MLNNINLRRDTDDGKYADVLDVCEFISSIDDRSASSALAAMVRASPTYAKVAKTIKGAAKKRKAKR